MIPSALLLLESSQGVLVNELINTGIMTATLPIAFKTCLLSGVSFEGAPKAWINNVDFCTVSSIDRYASTLIKIQVIIMSIVSGSVLKANATTYAIVIGI